jgi:hypothetical protein
MGRQGIARLVANAAVALALLLGATACAPREVHAGNGHPGDYGENAMASIEPPEYTTAEPPPPPPPPPPPMTQTCPDGSVSLATQACPPPPPEPSSAGPPTMGTLRPRPVRPASADAASAEPQPPATDTGGEDVDNQPFAGLGAFVKPPTWTVGNRYTLQFVVGQEQATLAEVSEDRELTTARRIWMASTMRVTLDPNPDFEIKPQNSEQEIQDLSPDRTAAWFWNVRPLKAGDYTLYARVETLERGPDGQLIKGADGKLKSHAYPPKKVDIRVRVGTQQGVMNAIDNASSFGDAFTGLFQSWQKALVALTALIVAASGAWLAIRRWGKPAKE